MTVALSRLLKSAYRKEPISTFIFLCGTVDALLGGFSERWTLLSLGVVLIMISVTVRWLQIQQSQKEVSPPMAKRYLNPSKSSIQPLPELERKQNYR
jgi:hypothetical protein